MTKIILTLNADGTENKRELIEEKTVIVGTLKSLQEEINSILPEKGLLEERLVSLNGKIAALQEQIDLLKGQPTETVTLPPVEAAPTIGV
jgi:predicted nuclease with TOPRIM domain